MWRAPSVIGTLQYLPISAYDTATIHTFLVIELLMADRITTDGGHAQQIRTKLLKGAYIIFE